MARTGTFVVTVELALLVTYLVLTCSAQQAPISRKPATGAINIQLRDVETGYGVEGRVEFAPAPLPWHEYQQWENGSQPLNIRLEKRKTDARGDLTLNVPAGKYLMEVNAPGYKPMRSYFDVVAGKSWTLGSMLDPIDKPEDLRNVDDLARLGFATAVGYVLDAETLRPIAGAQIQEKYSGALATTNARGFYALQVPVKPDPDNFCKDTLSSLSAKASGYKEFIASNVLLYNDQVGGGRNFELNRGRGTESNEEDWEAAASARSKMKKSATPNWWDVKPQPRSITQASEEIKKWHALAPEIEEVIRRQYKDCPGGNIHVGIFDAAKFPSDGPEVALVDYCAGGAYTDWILPMQLENSKPVLSKTRQKDGTLTTFDFASGSSAMNTGDVRLVPEDKAIYSIEYHTDGCTLLVNCRVTAFVWNAESGNFTSDAPMTAQATQGYCRSVQEGLKRVPRNPGPVSTPGR